MMTSDSAFHPPVTNEHDNASDLKLPGTLTRGVTNNPTFGSVAQHLATRLSATLPVVVLVQPDQLAGGEVDQGGHRGGAPTSCIVRHSSRVGDSQGKLPLVGWWRGQLQVEHLVFQVQVEEVQVSTLRRRERKRSRQQKMRRVATPSSGVC